MRIASLGGLDGPWWVPQPVLPELQPYNRGLQAGLRRWAFWAGPTGTPVPVRRVPFWLSPEIAASELALRREIRAVRRDGARVLSCGHVVGPNDDEEDRPLCTACADERAQALARRQYALVEHFHEDMPALYSGRADGAWLVFWEPWAGTDGYEATGAARIVALAHTTGEGVRHDLPVLHVTGPCTLRWVSGGLPYAVRYDGLRWDAAEADDARCVTASGLTAAHAG